MSEFIDRYDQSAFGSLKNDLHLEISVFVCTTNRNHPTDKMKLATVH